MAAAESATQNNRSRASEPLSRRSLTSTTALLAYLGLVDFVVHMAFAGSYGYFRDELYYIVSGTQHLSLGYVDFPPMIAYVAALLNVISHDSLVSIHIVPALAEGILVFVAGMITRELGGGRKAQLLAAVSSLLTLILLAEGSTFTPDALDELWWSLIAYLVIRLVKRRQPRTWLLVGLVAGVGLLTKATMLFFLVALTVSFLAIPSCRRYLRSKWLAAGALIAFFLVLPMIYWNLTNGLPMVHFYLEFRGDVGGGGPLGFLVGQLGGLTYLNVPILIAGLYFFLRSDHGNELRAFGLAYIVLYIAMSIASMKSYYIFPIYPVLFAGGAIAIERSSISGKGVSRWFGSRPYIACLAIIAILLSPLVMPILSPSTLIKTYGESTLSSANSTGASGEAGPLPQNLGDRFGWSTMVATLAQAYDTLPSNEKTQACIFTENYGEASAVNFLGRNMGLPEAISGHNSYYIWGPGSCTGKVLITVGYSFSSIKAAYGNVTLLATISCEYCMNLENNQPVYLCTNPTYPSISSEWSTVRHYD